MTAVASDVEPGMTMRRRRPSGALVIGGSAVVLAATVVLSLSLGATGISLDALPRVLAAVWNGHEAATPAEIRERLVLLEIRLPRTVLGLLVGAALAVSGAVMQGLFRNPLADPGLIGVSSTAALAAVSVIALGDGLLSPVVALLGTFAVPVCAFVGGLLGTAVLYRLATRGGYTSIATLLLAGIAVGALAQALLGTLQCPVEQLACLLRRGRQPMVERVTQGIVNDARRFARSQLVLGLTDKFRLAHEH